MAQQARIHDGRRGVASGENVNLVAVVRKILGEAQRPLDRDASRWGKHVSNDQDPVVIVRGRSQSQPPTITYRGGALDEDLKEEPAAIPQEPS